MIRFKHVTRLAVADYKDEWLLSLCSVFALAAALVPLLVLLGVKSGIIGTLTSRLLTDPRNLEVVPQGSGAYKLDWLNELATQGNVSFVLPQTRAISASLDFFAEGSNRSVALGLEPTKKGDPLLEKWLTPPASADAVVLSYSAAQKLQITQRGQTLKGRVSRRVNGQLEQEFITVTVQGILPLEAVQKDVAFVWLELLEAVEDYRDVREVPAFGWQGEQRPEPRTTYASFRLYAASLDGVEQLRDELTAKGISVYTRAEEIAMVRSLDNAFTILSILLFIVVGSGFFASTMSSALAQVNRKQRSLGVLRVLGFSAADLALFPLIQSLLTGLLGSFAALCLYFLAQSVINYAFQGQVLQQDAICRLPLEQAGLVSFVTCLFMVCGSLAAMRKVLAIDPAEVIRDV